VIERARRWSGLRADDVAERLGVSTETLSAWERGDPEFSIVQHAVEACGQDLHRLVAEPDPDPHDLSLLDESLRLTVEDRFKRLMRYVRFIEAGRRAMQAAR
jgi:transcriptional regulator with XRE-family HTH domain